MVHDFLSSGMWRDLFDRVFWVPLRNLKERPAPGYNLERFFFDEFFRPEGDRSGKLFAEETTKALKDNRTLFVLDGWDEVDRIANAGSDMSSFLRELLHRPNVIITSRPSASIPVPDQQPIDLELETIGFNPTQVDEYIEKTHGKTNAKKVDEIKTFLQSHELVRSLVRIPIQLDAFCYCWNDFNSDRGNMPETISALYQAIQTSLWKKDIEQLEKEHWRKRIQASDLKNADQLGVEKHVKDEVGFLEYLAFVGLVADKLEFESDYLNECATNSGSDLMLDKTLPCLSFLRSSEPSAEPIYQSYHFIHLTFQEYFAARYFVQHWKHCQPFKQHLFGQQSNSDVTPVEFLKKNKYNVRYDIMWRFVAGLLDKEDKEKNAGNFFEEIEKAPIDLLGPTHQRLVMHCLSETVHLRREVRKPREELLLQWVLFERDFTGSSTFVRESELPEEVFHSALTTSGRKLDFLSALYYPQRHLSERMVATLVELFKDESSDVRCSAAEALGNQSTLSDTTMAALMELFKDESSDVRCSAAEALGNQSTLSDTTIATLIELFKDENWSKQRSAASALGKQSTLSDTTVAALIELFKHKDQSIRSSAAKALGNQSTLSDTTIAALIELFKHKDQSIRSSAAKALGNQSTLSDTTIAALIELFKDEDRSVRRSAASALGNQWTLSDTTIAALIELFKDEDRSMH
ncbi:HEAT repeat-containing taxis protein [Colletotrichum spaethianum]|uniref:HEAT repeat-containing taxis protein n=1 Tax=Colletotrichum spaethianum TaxID=700344 RepID=A0AA37LG09_9PEZI|nr:HEAT repeat-containing taxis protein [Colletotrichum spaethianum]GKT45265.1 HEAT repeat-containing taxis protein [Colletotrichum spaethianum]